MSTTITSKKEIPNAPYYVLSNDTFMSNWRGATEHKTNTIILPCATYEEALIVLKNAQGRTDQAYERIVKNKPNLNNNTHVYSLATDDFDRWYKPGSWYSTTDMVVNVYTNGYHTRLLIDPNDLEEIIARCGWSIIDNIENFKNNHRAKYEYERIENQGFAKFEDMPYSQALSWWESHIIRKTAALTPDM